MWITNKPSFPARSVEAQVTNDHLWYCYAVLEDLEAAGVTGEDLEDGGDKIYYGYPKRELPKEEEGDSYQYCRWLAMRHISHGTSSLWDRCCWSMRERAGLYAESDKHRMSSDQTSRRLGSRTTHPPRCQTTRLPCRLGNQHTAGGTICLADI